MATVGTTVSEVATAGLTVILQNQGPGKVAFSYSTTPAVAAGGRGLILDVGESTDPFVAASPVYAVSDTAGTDLRVERF